MASSPASVVPARRRALPDRAPARPRLTAAVPASPGALVGRDAALAQLAAAAATAAAGQATVVSVVGAYGLGKSTLLDAVRADALARGATVLPTHGRAADAEIGFASLLTLLRPVESQLDRVAGDLAPELRAALALGPRAADPVAVRVATFRALGALAAERPLVLLVDDAHLLDRATADVLAFAAGRFCADAVLTVVATEPDVATGFDHLAPATVVLEALDPGELTRVVADSHPAVAAEPLRRCVALAEGNPLAALELAASLDGPQRAGEAPMPAIPRISGAIAQVLARRLDQVGVAARNALAMLAADDTGELLVVASALQRLGEPDAGLAEAEAAGLVAIDGATIRFTHPLLRPVAYHQVGAASRRVAHSALAAALDGPHQGVSRAWQLAAAADRPDESVATTLALVAADVARRGGTASAARTLECAAALAPGVDQRRDLLVAATRGWLDDGEAPAAARLAEQLATLPPTADAVAVAAEAMRGSRPAAQVLAFVDGSSSAVDTGGRSGVAAVLADEMLAAGAVAEAVELAESLVDHGGAPGRLAAAVLATAGLRHPDGAFRVPTVSSGGPGAEPATDSRSPTGGALEDRALVLATTAAADAGLGGASVRWADGGMNQGERGHRTAGGTNHTGPLRRPTLVAVGGSGLDLAVARAVAAMNAGEVAAAHDQLLRLDAVVGDRAGIRRAGLDLALGEAELLAARSTDARCRAEHIATLAGELGLVWLRGRAAWLAGRVALAEGDDPAAVEHLREASRLAPHLATADFVLAATAADRASEARTRAHHGRRWVGDPAPILDVRARRALGLLGTAAELDLALERAEAVGLPLEAAAVVVARAELAQRSGDDAAAAKAAVEARRRLAACGVTGWEPRLARLQRRRTPVPPTLASVLSPAQHRVALAVAEGRTNQQAAEALYVSVKTVDFHLQNIYRKLGLRSRTELAVVVHAGIPPVAVSA